MTSLRTKPDTVAAGPRFLNCSDTVHTQGPWSVDSNDARDEAQAILSDTTGCIVAEAYALDRPGDCEANARLIAASPGMLEALNAARAVIQDDRDAMFESVTVAGIASTMDEFDRPHVERLDVALAEINAAIARAEGRQS